MKSGWFTRVPKPFAITQPTNCPAKMNPKSTKNSLTVIKRRRAKKFMCKKDSLTFIRRAFAACFCCFLCDKSWHRFELIFSLCVCFSPFASAAVSRLTLSCPNILLLYAVTPLQNISMKTAVKRWWCWRGCYSSWWAFRCLSSFKLEKSREATGWKHHRQSKDRQKYITVIDSQQNHSRPSQNVILAFINFGCFWFQLTFQF